jgi:hypothetical protein
MAPVRIVLAGASGFLGTALRDRLTEQGHDLVQLVRREPGDGREVRWDPDRGVLAPSALEGADAVVNLAGTSFYHWPWTSSYRASIRASRVASTATLAAAIAACDSRPALVNASGTNVYGDDRGDEVLTEDSSAGTGFLAGVVLAWERATGAASRAGSRVVLARTAPVFARHGGMLRVVGVPFRLGLGARLGSGRQWFSSISLPDYLAVVTRMVTDSSLSGPFNVVAPEPATNAEFTTSLGRHLHRPTVLAVPSFAIRLGAGAMAPLVLGSLRVRPARLLEAGFEFAHPGIDDQLGWALSSGSSAAS